MENKPPPLPRGHEPHISTQGSATPASLILAHMLEARQRKLQESEGTMSPVEARVSDELLAVVVSNQDVRTFNHAAAHAH